MNASRMIISLVRRSYGAYSGWKKDPNPGIQSRLKVLEDEAAENDVETIENLDLEDEPDFSQAHQSYDSYKEELTKKKELLKLRIVARKYFKESEPNLLTYIEKEQIRYLHQSDPVEYTPEKLSESFPALSPTIRKILKAKWIPRSADRVLKHDQHVIENWRKFKRGELPVEPRLREHLQKFKARKISLPDREELEKKIIPPERTFAKPKSQLYSGIIQTYLEQRKDIDSSNEDPSSSTLDKKRSELRDSEKDERLNYNDLMDVKRKDSAKKERMLKLRNVDKVAILGAKELSSSTRAGGKDFVTLDEFFEKRMKSIDDTSSVEDKVLVDAYKKKIESEIGKERNASSNDRLRERNFMPQIEESNSVTLLTKEDFQSSVQEHRYKPNVEVIVDDSKEMGLETYVKARETKEIDDENYPQTIAIPRNKYKKGKLYKLGDCYYDNDGEFLYRVPGFKN